MVVLLQDNELILIDTMTKVKAKQKEILKDNPNADLELREPTYCGSCHTAYENLISSLTCPCHEY